VEIDEAAASEPPVQPAPDVPENDGVAEQPQGSSGPRKPRQRNRRHGRRR
jgi:hypothetical protein